ncbi:MAG TPA: hypothetical protein VFC03_03900 [Acidimicrobiales bacterium]|nr:hypothetical protein [Acidimicrobiales bacterium]
MEGVEPRIAFVGLVRVTVAEGWQADGTKKGEQPLTVGGLTVNVIVAVV